MNILIGDTTLNNHNVIFEIGYAAALKKPYIILRKSSYTVPPPFDIDKILYKQYQYDSSKFEDSLKSIIKVNLPVILKDDFGLVVNPPIKIASVKKEIVPKESENLEKLSKDEIIRRELEEYEEMYHLEAVNAVAYTLSKAEWDFDNGQLELLLNGKTVKVTTYEQLTNLLEDIAKEAGYPLIAEEGEDRERIFNNIDWDEPVQAALMNYKTQLQEIGWV